MFERFEPDARDAVTRARAEAIRTGHAQVGATQLLVGLSAGPGVAADALRDAGITVPRLRALLPSRAGETLEPLDAEALSWLGIDLDTVTRATDAAFGPGALTRTRPCPRRSRWHPEPRMAEGTRAALALSLHAARRLGHDHIGSGHVLLGLLDQPASPAVAALRAANVALPSLRADLHTRLAGPPGPSGPAGGPEGAGSGPEGAGGGPSAA